MINGQPCTLVNHIRKIVAVQTFRDSTDRELVELFVSRGDEPAFAALVERHGSMVLGVCRRVLRRVHDAEDASQATFLVLARKAGAIQKKDSLASWLHGVAFRVASDLKRRHARHHAGTAGLEEASDADTVSEVTWREVQATLDEELQELPEHYRDPLILCYLEGKARGEAALQLGWSSATLKSRLEGARASLRRRLVRRGIAPSVALLSAVFAESGSAAMSATLVLATVKAAPLAALGKAVPGTVIAGSVVSVAERVVNGMFVSKLKAVVGVVLALSLMVSGATVMSFRTATASNSHLPAAEDQPAAAQKLATQKKEAFTAWGKEARVRVYIENVNAETATITASCMLIGEFDNVTKPMRFENLRVKDRARITDGGKHLKLGDLQSLPRDTHYYLFLKTYEEEFGFEVVGIETIRPAPAIEKNVSPKKEPDAAKKPIKIRVSIEKVNLPTATITASCMLIGLADNVTKPVRLENLQVAQKAKIRDHGKELKLADLTSLPRGTHFYLWLRVYEGEEFGFEVIGIESITLPAKAGSQPPARKRVEGEKRITIRFDKASWKDVLAWYSDQNGLPIVSGHPPPPGSFSHTTPNGTTYSIHEVTVLLNESLMKQGYVLVPRKQSVVMLKIVK